MFTTGTFVKVAAIDMDGLNGRTPHPPADLAGQYGQIQGVTEAVCETTVYRVTMQSGRFYDLADYELEVIQPSGIKVGSTVRVKPYGGCENGEIAKVVELHPAGRAAVIRVYETGVQYSESIGSLEVL